MKALTIWQPYASLIADGVKLTETRGWITSYRGPLLIHAGAAAFDNIDTDEFPSGVIVALVDLYDVSVVQNPIIQAFFATQPDYPYGNFEVGRKVWHLRNVRKLSTPIPHSGKRGVWDVSKELEEQVNEQVG